MLEPAEPMPDRYPREFYTESIQKIVCRMTVMTQIIYGVDTIAELSNALA